MDSEPAVAGSDRQNLQRIELRIDAFLQILNPSIVV